MFREPPPCTCEKKILCVCSSLKCRAIFSTVNGKKRCLLHGKRRGTARGIMDTLCTSCAKEGMVIRTGRGDGLTRIYDKHGELVEKYNTHKEFCKAHEILLQAQST